MLEYGQQVRHQDFVFLIIQADYIDNLFFF